MQSNGIVRSDSSRRVVRVDWTLEEARPFATARDVARSRCVRCPYISLTVSSQAGLYRLHGAVWRPTSQDRWA